MISVEQARLIILNHTHPLDVVQDIAVSDALGYRLAHELEAALDLPPFDQSNVDGYALGPRVSEQEGWKVLGEIPAGIATDQILGPGEAMRIFTGAVVPQGSVCVIMQEKMKARGKQVYCTEKESYVPGQFIRKQGTQIRKGVAALAKGSWIQPSLISYLNALGMTRVKVYGKPRIVLVITGNELCEPGKPLTAGQNYESNSAGLQAALQQMGLGPAEVLFARDERDALSEVIGKGLIADVLLVSGGISVGDYDFVKEVLLKNGTSCLFHGIAQKPGKPLFFGKRGETLVFGLPGNPASALTCFYEYVRPALRRLRGHSEIFLDIRRMTLLKAIARKPGLSQFLKALVSEEGVLPLDGQDSFIMKSLAAANSLIYIPADMGPVPAGETVEVHLLPEI